ncbi:hypothetical protein HNY73_010516 [Argiope bruennichi]|uniref:Uncharacterized protein n=1 Tax=Argiope bruennichi TaxID=94029 RepID=A0A8T0F1A4_ARGBR|nr:hypothetical protein HNY73_010516 [Argiope bruennichi]
MALDLKMEIFAHNSFYRIWNKGVKEKENLNIHQIYGEECCKIENVSEACEEVLISGIVLRRMMFNGLYMADFTDEIAKSLKSLSECYDYIIYKCDRSDLFGHLTVFERMFATFGFVIEFCSYIYKYYNVDIVKYGHILWIMYFDKFTEEFYKEGGWKQLKKVAESYNKIIGTVFCFDGQSIHSLKMALEKYCDFRDAVYYDELKNKQKKKVHVSKLWIKHNIEQLDNLTIIPFISDYDIALVAENLLEKLIKLHDLISEERAFSKEMECTETPIEHVGNGNHSDDLQTTHFSEINQDVSKEKSTEASYPEDIDNQTEIARRKEVTSTSGSTSQMIKSDKVENSSSYFLPPQQFIDSFIDNLYSSNTEMKKKTPTSPEVLLTDQTDKSFQNKEAKLEVMAAQKCCTENEDASNNDKEIRNEKSVEMSYSENGDDRREISRRMEIPSTSQMIKSDKDENSSSYFLPPQQFIDSFIDNLYSSNTEMKKKTPTSPEVLLTDQTDKSFQNKEAKLEVMAAQKFCTENEDASNNDKEIRNEKSVEMSYSENGDDRRKISRRMEIPSTSQMIKSDKDENSSSYFLPPQQFIDSFIDNLYQNKEAKLEVMAAQKFCTENEDASNNDKEIRNEKSVEMSYSENGDDRTEISRRMEITSTSKLTESYMDENSSLILPKQFIDNLYSSNTEKRIETPTPTEVLSTKQMDKTFHYPYKVKNTWNFCSKSRDTNDKVEEVNSDKSLDVSCCSKKEEEQSEIIREADIISTSQMDEPEWNTNITPDVLLKPKVFDFENQGGSIGDEIEKIETSREDLRKEQDDREINIFLRMILILSDRQRAKFVHQEFLDNEVTPQNVQELLDNEETSQNVQELLGNMSSDLKIEVFAYQCFYRTMFGEGIVDKRNILKIYEDECKEDNSYQEVCDILYQRAAACRVRVFDEFPKSSDTIKTKITNMNESFENGKKITCTVGISGIETEENLDIYSLKRCNNLCDGTLSQQMQTSKEYFTKSSDFELNYNLTSFAGNNKNDLGDTSRRKNFQHHSEVMNTTDALPINWKDEPAWQRKSLKNLSNPLDFCYETKLLKSQIGNEISEAGMESTFNTKTEVYDENTDINHTLSTNKIVKAYGGRNTILKNPHLPKNIVEVSEIKTNPDEKIKPDKGLDILREEMNDPDIKIFLRTILVLDDRQSIQYFYEAESCSKQSRENLQVREVKKKKISKNKSRK